MLKRALYIIPSLLLSSFFANAQFKIRGTVYDSSRSYPMEAVTVQSSGGRATQTNAEGFYEIEVSEKDSIWFSYLGKPTVKFPVLKITDPMAFDISLHVLVPIMKEVKVRPRYYRQDSIQNRQDYARIFNFEKPKLRPQVTGFGVGFDLNEIVNMFRFRRNRSMLAFQQRLLAQEQEKFVDHRFNKVLVRRLTLLEGQALDSFMLVFRPSFYFTRTAGEYEFQKYIRDSHARFKRGLPPLGFRSEEGLE